MKVRHRANVGTMRANEQNSSGGGLLSSFDEFLVSCWNGVRLVVAIVGYTLFTCHLEGLL